MQQLDEKKPVIMCGDLNVAHQEIDLKNPKPIGKMRRLYRRRREKFTEFLDSGFTDTFRYFILIKQEFILGGLTDLKPEKKCRLAN